MHELKTGLYADKFAIFFIFPERFLSLIRFANDPYTVYNGLNASRLARFRKKNCSNCKRNCKNANSLFKRHFLCHRVLGP